MLFNQNNQNAGDVNNQLPPDPTAPLRTLVHHAWKWDLPAFAKRLGRDPLYCREAFVRFQEIASRLRRLDDEVLTLITTPDLKEPT